MLGAEEAVVGTPVAATEYTLITAASETWMWTGTPSSAARAQNGASSCAGSRAPLG